MTEKEEKVIEALSYVIEPDLKKDIISAGLVKNLQIDGNAIKFDLQISNPAMHNRRRIEEACLHHLQTKVDDNVQVEINFVSLPKQTERPPELRTVLPNVKNLIAVGSGKGGVGKSTVTANLAVALAKEGYKVGLIDADIYGPSMPLMFDVQKEKPVTELVDGKQLIKPIESYGVKLLSIGFFADTDQAIVWRGAMATKALKQLILDANWGELDFLLFDLPPGTGDIHL
ncbi:MAG TPA: chromosome partitioning protein, partial [Flavobacteriales bacterium]|nr:chromosome partitioning protein [Flavobacteriales bacterium]